MFVRSKSSDDPSVLSLEDKSVVTRAVTKPGRLLNEFGAKRFNRGISDFAGGDWELFSSSRVTTKARRWKEVLQDTDIIHLHWISKFLDYSFDLRHIADKPIVWTLHDMNVFTGGCHYTAGCEGFRSQCGGCPALRSNDSSDLPRRIWKHKSDFTEQIRNHSRFVGVSQWTSDQARCSSLLEGCTISTIHHGLDQSTFYPHDKAACRKEFGLPQDARILMFVADDISNSRKGMDLLSNAIELLPVDLNLFLLTVGGGHSELTWKFPSRAVGRVDNDQDLSRYLSCADLFTIASKQEAFGMVTMEAMACGVPAIGFSVGGIVDLIKHEENGILVEPFAIDQYAKAIERLVQSPDVCVQYGENAMKTISSDFTLRVAADKYISLYESLLSES